MFPLGLTPIGAITLRDLHLHCPSPLGRAFFQFNLIYYKNFDVGKGNWWIIKNSRQISLKVSLNFNRDKDFLHLGYSALQYRHNNSYNNKKLN